MRGWLAALLIATPAWADPTLTCLADPLEQEAAAKAAFHRNMAAIIAEKAPEHTDLARLSAEYQGALAERRVARIVHLLEADPGRLPDPNAFRAFGWNEADEVVLTASDPSYGVLTARVQALEAESEGHPGWPALRAVMRERLETDPAYTTLLRDFTAELGGVRTEIASCFGG
ncbi:MAG: hypothetical protein AAFR79_03620 [Pseudomonadota bacterium]